MEALIYNNHRRVALLLHKLKPGCTDQLPGDQQTCTNSVFLQPAGCNALVLIEHYVTLSLPQQWNWHHHSQCLPVTTQSIFSTLSTRRQNLYDTQSTNSQCQCYKNSLHRSFQYVAFVQWVMQCSLVTVVAYLDEPVTPAERSLPRSWSASRCAVSNASVCSSRSRCSLRLDALMRDISSSDSSNCLLSCFTRLFALSICHNQQQRNSK